LGEVDKLKLVR